MTFDFERMDVYQLALEAIDRCMAIIVKMPRGNGDLADQLKRAVTRAWRSICRRAPASLKRLKKPVFIGFPCDQFRNAALLFKLAID